MRPSLVFTILLGVILGLATPMYALLSDYSFTTTVTTYTEITGGLLLGTESSDDQRFVDPTIPAGGTTTTGVGLPIGFSFAFNDYVFDVIAVNNNGWISFGQSALTPSVNNTSSSSYNPLSSTSVITPPQLHNRVAAMSRDLQAQVGASLRMETIGAAPNRICVIQYKNYKRYGTTGTGDIYNFQIQLHENQSKVAIVYGTITNNATATTVMVGLRGSDTTDFFNRTNTTDWLTTTPGGTNAATCALSATIFPPSGTTFTFAPPVPATNDLQALAVSGTSTPSVGSPSNYTISVRNRGSAQQTNYTVKLMQGTTELGSVPGPAIASMQVIDVVIPWTPTVQGPATITGMVVLAGDENTLNDVSPPFNVTVFPAGTLMTIIGTGTSANSYLFYTTYGYSRNSAIYTAAELVQPGLISGIMWDCAVPNSATVPYRILMKNTTLTANVLEPWATTITDAQLCAEGTVTVDQAGWIYFPFTVPFFYSGDNLQVMVENNVGGTGLTNSPTFRYTTSTTGAFHYIYADTTPPTTNGYLTTSRLNVGISFQVGGMGALGGTVTSDGSPLDGAHINIDTTPLNTNTNTLGTYNFPFVSPGTYQVTCSKLGYQTQTLPATIAVGATTTLNFAMVASTSVGVTGTVVGSDAPTVGLANATVNLTGVVDYSGTTNASGVFNITGVLSGNTYDYSISKQGYQNASGTITVGDATYNMGTVTLNEIAIPPGNVTATLNGPQTDVTVTWRAPGAAGPSDVDNFDTTDGGWVPTSNWSNPLGDWQWTSNYNPAVYTDIDTYVDVPPTTAHSGTGMWGTVIQGGYSNCTGWSYLRKTYNFTGITNPVINFWHYMDGYNTWDYGLIVVNGTTVWGSSALAEFMPWQVLNVDLSAYANNPNVQISFEWYATSVVSYAGWYIDDVYVGSANGVPTRSLSNNIPGSLTPLNDRSLVGYKVFRLLQGEEQNETSWITLTPTTIVDTVYVNTGFLTWPDGEYKWAVKGVYTNNVLSNPSFSNMIMKRPNDLSALSISGSANPSVGNPYNYTIQVRNTGSSPQTAGSYTVKIFSGTTELASIAGPAIGVGETIDVIVPWTPTTEGALSIYGKVVLPTDTLPTNDSTTSIDVFVHPFGTHFVVIGDGTSSQRQPLGILYGYERDATIYTQDEIGLLGLVTGVQWYCATTAVGAVPFRILMKTTPETALVAQPWDTTITNATVVLDTTYTFTQTGWHFFPLTTHFPYTQDNLVVMVETSYGGAGTTSGAFRYTVGPTASHHYMYADTNPPTTNGYLNTYRPNIGMSLRAGGTEPQFNVNPASYAYGQVLINTTVNKTISITNIGGGTNPLIINSITISGSPFFTLQNLPTLPISLGSFQQASFIARYNPTAAGEHTATITITDNLARSYTIDVDRRSSNNNLRNIHPVPLTATAVDVTIYSLPYFQNFDAVTVPNLPVDWNSIFTSPGVVATYASSPHSTPNCVRIYNSTSTAGPYLIAPPLVNTISMNTVRVRFWAKGSTSYVLSVGVTADPLDSGTYEQVSSFNLTSSWAEYVVGFQTYAGAGHFITFKHGNAATSQTIYVDDVMIEIIADNDLAAISLSGNESPSVGNPYTYTVGITNWGNLPQTNYLVKLYDGNNLELASAAGPAIAPGLTLDATVQWTPTTQGAANIYGKVVLTGDQNNLNDSTPTMPIYVHPAGTQMVIIGNGTSTARYPMGSLYGYERDEVIYTEDQFNGVVGRITGVQWYATTQYGNVVPYKIYLKNTTATALVTQPWDTSIADATLMVEGTHTFDQTGWIYFPFPDSSNFVYLGGNLVVMVETNYGGTGTTSSQYFRYTTGPTASHHYIYQESTPPTSNGYLTTSKPNIGISFGAIGTTPAFAVSPANYNYGQTFMNTTINKTFSITNIGGGTTPLIINSITISGSPFFTLQNMPTLPVSLSGFQSTTFVARYNPTAVGNHTATITITDDLARTYTYRVGRQDRDGSRLQHPVQLTAECIDPTIYTSPYVQNFDAVTAPVLPIDWTAYVESPGICVTYTTTPNSTPNCVRLYNSTSAIGPFLISPPISNTMPLNTMRIKFWAKGAVTYNLSIGALTDPYNVATYTEVTNFNLTSTAWTEYVVGFQTYTGAGQFMCIKHGDLANSQYIYIDDVTIEVIPENDLAATTITGNSSPSVGMPFPYTIGLFNWGTLPQSNYTVKLFDSNNVELTSVPGPTINPGLAGSVVINWAPSATGAATIYGKVVLTGDQNNLNDRTPDYLVNVYPAGTVVFTIGTGTTSNQRQPLGIYYGYERDASLIEGTNIGMIGMLTGFQWMCYTANATPVPFKVYIKPTTETAMVAQPWDTMVTGAILVHEDTLAFNQVGWTPITFDIPYIYLGGNFIVLVETFYGGAGVTTYPRFNYTTGPTGSHQYWYADNAPPTNNGSLNTYRPNIGIFMLPGGVGHLNGHVYGAGNIPLQNATVQIIGGAQATTNAQGQYSIINIIADDYQVTASRYGYISDTLPVTIVEDLTQVLDFTLTQMPTVNVTGTIIGSDTGAGLASAVINLTGYENYTVTANGQGAFTIPGVYTNQTYQYQATALGYQVTSGTMNVGTVDFNMGNIIVNEIAYTPRNVTATQNTAHTQVTVSWVAPDPNAVDITESFEGAVFPPTDWTRIVTNNGPANTAGVYPTWCRFGEVISGTDTVTPPEGSWQCGFWWDYNHQDEWLITPQFNCPQGAYLTFGTYCYRGSMNNDHYYVKVSNNDGVSWDIVWDASALTGGWNNYATPVQIDLSAYTGQQIKIAWHADDPNTTSDGMWWNWFIDNVIISNTVRTIVFSEDEMTVRSASAKITKPQTIVTDMPMSRAIDSKSLDNVSRVIDTNNHSNTREGSRSLLGYMVWRLVQGQEQNETTWTELTPVMISALTLTDTGWAALAPGTYKWAIKAIYTGNVYSLGAFSNPVVKDATPMGTLAGTIRNQANLPIMGATITAGAFVGTSAANGSYAMQVATGTYAVTCSAPGYSSVTTENVVINEGMTTIANFTLTVGNTDIIEVTQTALKGNFPNPFNPETTINFDVKDASKVRIEIYNTKGQLIRTLVDEFISKGQHHVVWNGKDNHGNSVASGIYHYRMQAGNYKATRRMMLLK